MSRATIKPVVASRAAAYDDVYRQWHAKRVTVESFEQWAQFYLDPEAKDVGHLNGDEIACAMRELDVENLAGKRVLDLCCGAGRTSIYFALKGARVDAIDMSGQAIELARESAKLSCKHNMPAFSVMDAQALTYPDDSFDAIYCQSALHILVEYPAAALELARVLKSDRKLIFCEEALGHNWLMAPIRYLRRKRYEACGGRPILYADIEKFGRPFASVELHHFNLLSQLKMLVGGLRTRPWCKSLLRGLYWFDELLLRAIPFLRRYCGKVVVVYSQPRKPNRCAEETLMTSRTEASDSTQVQASRPTGTVASDRTAKSIQDIRAGSAAHESIDYIYILSASHSGSTLLTMLLASHPEIATVGETSAVLAVGDRDVGLCSCGDSVAHCRFWSAIREEMFRRGVDAARADFGVEYRMPGHRLIDRALRAEFRGPLLELCRDVTLTMSAEWREREQAISQANRCLIESITEHRGSRHFVDSSKEAHRLKFMRRIGGLRTRVIHLMRDGRGVAASYMKKSQMSMADAVTDWKRSVRAQELMLKTLNERDILRLRYEDLCSDVTGCMRRIFEFIGIEPRHDISNYHKCDHHVLGNRMRLSGSAEIRLDEKWRTSLTAEHLATFRSKAGAINHRYGYE